MMTDDTILTVTLLLAGVLVLALYAIFRERQPDRIQDVKSETTAEHMKRVLGPAQQELQQKLRRVK